ncbi:metallophosphoesterase family protein [Pelagibacterium limicola]|uniref:metallophosphoesterase family protein n=1 Tax=Pelagibacterium limicola TaxID=2791022 RepID=UPI0018AF55DC|nr:metallophosphoesterase [Pelagibacterium limicola]
MRLIHLSDLHFGHHDDAVVDTLSAEIRAQNPDLIVVSGDFTQIGSRREFARAREFLDTLSAPVFAVPGNHDVPERNLVKRFINPYGHYRKYIHEDLEPFGVFGDVAIAGIKTSRRARLSFNWSDGTISRAQLERIEQRFDLHPEATCRVIVAHHPLLHPEEPMARFQRRVKRADKALEVFARIGVRLVLSGHFHLSYVRRHEGPGAVREAAPVGPRFAASAPILVAQASSTTSTRLRGEPNAYNVIEFHNGEIDIAVREWLGSKWVTREKTSESELPPVPADQGLRL